MERGLRKLHLSLSVANTSVKPLLYIGSISSPVQPCRRLNCCFQTELK